MDDMDVLTELGDTTRLLLDAKNGLLSDEPQTHTYHFLGDTDAEALGHAYHIRDAIREAGYSCEAEYIGEVDSPEWSEQPFHRVEIRINVD